MASEKNLNFFHSINIICTKLIQSMGIYGVIRSCQQKKTQFLKNYTPSVNGSGILKRVSFSVRKSSLYNSEAQMFLISVLLSHWYLLEVRKISRVHAVLISQHDWVQVWEEDSECSLLCLSHILMSLRTLARIFVSHLTFNIVIFLNENSTQWPVGNRL